MSKPIFSNDPHAIEDLNRRIARLEKHQETMKAANAAIRLKDTTKGNAKLTELGFTPDEIAKLRTPDFCGRVGYPAYELSNNSANIRRLKDRVAAITKERDLRVDHIDAEEDEIEGTGYTMKEDATTGRIQFFFPGKPSAEVRETLKGWGFRWAPSIGAWQRFLNANGRYAAQKVREYLDATA